MNDIVNRWLESLLLDEYRELYHSLNDKQKRLIRFALMYPRLKDIEAIESLRQQVADWTRRAESCESKLGQIEANEQLVAERVLIDRLLEILKVQLGREYNPFEPTNQSLHYRNLSKLIAEVEISRISSQKGN